VVGCLLFVVLFRAKLAKEQGGKGNKEKLSGSGFAGLMDFEDFRFSKIPTF